MMSDITDMTVINKETQPVSFYPELCLPLLVSCENYANNRLFLPLLFTHMEILDLLPEDTFLCLSKQRGVYICVQEAS